MIDTQSEAQPGFLFGIYPGGAAGAVDEGSAEGPPDNPDRINQALDMLQFGSVPFLVRAYQPFTDAGDTRIPAGVRSTPAEPAQYVRNGRKLDLVLQFLSSSGDVEGYTHHVRETVRALGPALGSVQITEEPNVADSGYLDGAYPRVLEALIQGVIAAKQATIEYGNRQVRVGFNSAVPFGPGAAFFDTLAAAVTEPFLAALDYVGFDFFPDVFAPIDEEKLPEAVSGLVEYFRSSVLAAASIPASVPIHITEHGWPTGNDRPASKQARILDAVVRTLVARQADLNITGYTFFTLRDALSSNPAMSFQFGLLRDDYSPKPAFETYRQLIRTLGISIPVAS